MSTAIRKSVTTQDELNNDYDRRAEGVGHGGTTTETRSTPKLVSGVGRVAREECAIPVNAGGVGHAGSEDMPGAPVKTGGEGRGGLQEKDPNQGELLLEANGI